MKILPSELAFDIDGVFADSFRLFIRTAREQYGISIEYEDITDYDFRRVIDIDEKTRQEIINEILDNPLEIGIQAISGAVRVLTSLSNLGPLLFVTARPNRDAILEWVQNKLELVDDAVIHLEATGTQEEKLPVLLRHGVKYFVEDCLETCYLLEETSVSPIVFEQPWNRKPHPFHKVRNWDEISAMIEW
ncbi:MAG: haloacid dehalogenase [Thermodesulfobacteriota bacterium]|nr:haloacid dehalogenase [Thermodesulfobacteriota bacterium]